MQLSKIFLRYDTFNNTDTLRVMFIQFINFSVSKKKASRRRRYNIILSSINNDVGT